MLRHCGNIPSNELHLKALELAQQKQSYQRNALSRLFPFTNTPIGLSKLRCSFTAIMQALRSSTSLRTALRSAPSVSRAYSVAAPTGYAATNKNLRVNGKAIL